MPEPVANIVRDLGGIPIVSSVANRVIKLASDNECSLKELQQLIESEPSLAAQIMKVANSAMFGSMRTISTLPQAITILGLENVKCAVMASVAKNMYMKSTFAFYKIIYWEHSLVAALASCAMAKIFHFRDPDEVFLATLLHDIGMPVLNFKFPEHYQKIIKAIYNGEMTSALSLELETFGFDHQMVGEALLDSWDFPKSLSQAVRWHHSPGNAEPEHIALTAYTSLGNLFALEMGKGIKKPKRFDDERKVALKHLGIAEMEFDSQIDTVLQHIEADKTLITGF